MSTFHKLNVTGLLFIRYEHFREQDYIESLKTLDTFANQIFVFDAQKLAPQFPHSKIKVLRPQSYFHKVTNQQLADQFFRNQSYSNQSLYFWLEVGEKINPFHAIDVHEDQLLLSEDAQLEGISYGQVYRNEENKRLCGSELFKSRVHLFKTSREQKLDFVIGKGPFLDGKNFQTETSFVRIKQIIQSENEIPGSKFMNGVEKFTNLRPSRSLKL
ncbi:MAG: hypothetical protein ACPGJV_12625 [Bacteriovoracaceae bacterium]